MLLAIAVVKYNQATIRTLTINKEYGESRKSIRHQRYPSRCPHHAFFKSLMKS
ncbi:hypothetical protein BRC2024_OQYPJBKP_CDS_0037 [Acinetobacter phage vB_AbaM_Highwayman]